MFELHHLSAQEQWDWLHRGEIEPIELVEHYLERIFRLNPNLGAFVTITEDAARESAKTVNRDNATRPLWGLPIADKDLQQRKGVRTTFGSALFKEFVPTNSDELTETLDAAGAISLGKTNTPEFGLSSYTENAITPPTRNPYDLDLGPGGSSGGAAVAVAAGMLPFAPGSDGGGSVRIPAAATGLVGVKPSRGLLPAGSGLDKLAGLVVPGPIARSVADAAMLLDAMCGGDYEFTLRAQNVDKGAYLNSAVRGEGRFQIGVMTSSPWDFDYEIQIEADALAAFEIAKRELDALGHGLEETRLPEQDFYADCFRTIWKVGAGVIPVSGSELELLEPLTRWLIAEGRSISAVQLADALSRLTNFERSVNQQFASFDAVLTPALAQSPRPIGWYSQEDPELNFAQQVQYTPFTSFVNVTGLPAIVLPVHVSATGLPMGVQLIGKPGGERALFAIGAQLERRLQWQKRHPPQW
ncbi:MAG: amidase [Microbacteriaceae bacterium]|nr:amidase [Cryobacterium sp.]MCC6375457.1 amidase [Microbacteriaceae bacterium]